jgi:Reverse transcriptase (RNA-dependent DNA polymerase)
LERIANNDDDDDVIGSLMIQKVNNGSETNTNSAQPEINDKSNLKIYRQMKRLQSSFNPEATKIIDDFDQGTDILLDSVNLALICGNVMKEPKSFDYAWNCSDPDQRTKWRAAIKKDFSDMERRNVWDVISKEEVPKDRRCILCMWIFNIKRNGVFRARLVACAYSQVPGVDFNESFAPVINDVSFRVMLITKLIWGLQTTIIDVETAFLHGNQQEEIYMNIPRFKR